MKPSAGVLAWHAQGYALNVAILGITGTHTLILKLTQTHSHTNQKMVLYN